MSTVDTIILVGYLAVVLLLGWICRKEGNSATAHFLAGRKMGMLSIGISIMVTTFSAINYVSIPEEVSSHGIYVVFSFPIFFLAAWPISRIWMPYFHKLQATTVYEFLEKRYDRRVRLLASGVFLLWRIIWMAIALYVSGKILSAFSGYSLHGLCIVCGIVATLYTAFGGMKAVMYTDVLQFCVLIAGIVLCLALAMNNWNGTSEALLDTFSKVHPFDYNFFSPDPRIRMTLWSCIFGVFASFMARYGADQVVMQRYFTAKDLNSAQRGIWLNAAASVLALSLLALLGIVFCSIQAGSSAKLGFLKQLVMLLRTAPAGVTGLIVASILAATMSSVDSGINACSACLVTDFRAHCSTRWLTLGIGLAVTVLAITVLPPLNRQQGIFAIVNKLVNGMGSPLLAIVCLGMFSRRTNAPGVFWGGIFGVVASLLVTIFLKPLALQYYAVVNALLTFAACWLASFAIREKTRNTRK